MPREIVMVRDGNSLRPHTAHDLELLQQVESGKPIMVELKQGRNIQHHRKLFGLMTAVANFDDDFLDAEDVLEWVKLRIPAMREIKFTRSGETRVRTKSISFAAMDQVAFNDFYKRALDMLAVKIGCDPETLMNEVAAA